MKTLRLLWMLVVGLACFSSVGCAPKNTKGQVFIVTRSAENIKLGLVDVLLLDEQDVTSFMQSKKSAVEAEISLRAEKLRKAEGELLAVQQAIAGFRKTNEVFQPAFLENKVQVSSLKREIVDLAMGPTERIMTLTKKSEALFQQSLASRNQSSKEIADQLLKALKFGEEFDKETEAISRLKKANIPVLESKRARLAEIERQIAGIAENADKKMIEFTNRFVSVSKICEDAKIAVARFPSLEFYLSAPLPAPRVKSVTDADGKFEIKLPRKGKFAVFAQASRRVGVETERYAWFFWLPTVNEEMPLMLSNNNLVFTDFPGNVLPVKPKKTD